MLIFGTGELAEVAQFYFADTKKITGFTVDEPKETSFNGLPIIPWSECKPDEIYIAIGSSAQNKNREAKLLEAMERRFLPQSFVSPKAHLIGAYHLGIHCMILEANVIQPFVRIGTNSILWSGNHIGHHARIGANCFITSHVVISGGCDIGENSFIGVNSCVADHVKIGNHSIVTMGSRVTKDLPEEGVWDLDAPRNIKSSRLKI